MKIKKRFAIICVYLCFGLAISLLFRQSGMICALERNVCDIDIDKYCVLETGYIYGIDRVNLDQDETYKMGLISGWYAENEGQYFYPAAEALVLSSENNSYEVKIYRETRPDLLWLDQTKEKNTQVGFTARFPSENIQEGEYRIGFVSKQNGKNIIAWTNEYVTI